MALLLAGLPVEVPGATVNRLCGSGLDAVATRRAPIAAGEADLVLAGGVETMTRAPFVDGEGRPSAFDRAATSTCYDTTLGWRFVNPAAGGAYGTDSMGETAENVAEQLRRLARRTRTRSRCESQQRAAAAQDGGPLRRARSCRSTCPQPQGRARTSSTRDEHPRRTPRWRRWRGCSRRSAQGGTVTAGNSSGLNDGAAALLLASEAARGAARR